MNSIFGTLFVSVALMWIYDGLKHPKTNSKVFGWSLLGLVAFIGTGILAMVPATSGNRALGFIALYVVPNFMMVEGGFALILLALLFHIFREHRLIQIVFLLILGALSFATAHGDVQWMMIFAAPLLYLYNGKRGRNGKWFLYIFYTTHIAVLYILATVFFK